MVNLTIDPPPMLRTNEPRKRGGKGYAIGVLVLAVAAGGFVLGRKTAPKPICPEIASTAPEAPATQGAPGAPPAGAQAGAPVAPPLNPSAVRQPEGEAPAIPAAGQLQRISVVLRGSLEESVAAALPENQREGAPELTQMIVRLLIWHLDVTRDGRKGDRMEAVFQPGATGQGDLAVVEAVRYSSQKFGKTFTAYRFKAPSVQFARYYQADGSEVEERLVDGPIENYEQVTSLLRDGRRHKGVDFKTPTGTPVVAPFDGTVVRRNWHFSANGNCLELVDSKTGRHAIFLHLESVARELQAGSRVKKGAQIALSGNTGHSTAPHLHYQLESGGRVLDPFAVHGVHRIALEAADRAAFEVEKKRFDDLLGPAVAVVAEQAASQKAAPTRRSRWK